MQCVYYKDFTVLRGLVIACLLCGFLHSSAQHYDAEVMESITNLEATEGKLIETYQYEIKINNRNGDKYAEVEIPFDKMNKVNDIEASIIDNTGKEVKTLKRSDIIERSASSDINFYSDNYVKEFALRHNTYPYTFRYSYRTTASQFLVIADWDPVIDHEIPTHHAILKLKVPRNYILKFTSNLVGKPGIDTTTEQTIYSWQSSYDRILKPETWSPPAEQLLPRVEIVPLKFKYDHEGSNKSWITFGDWNLSLLDGLNDLPEKEKGQILSLVQNAKDDKEKIRLVYHYLQKATRYISVSIKTGGLIPYPASYVADKKYGDCKALANYFIACLEFLKIKAFYTVIYAGDEIGRIDTALPSQQFNHVIALVPYGHDSIWLDCTSDFAFGYTGTFTQNRFALVENTHASKLVMTPAMTYEDVAEIRNICLASSADNKVTAVFNNKFRGDKYELIHSLTTYLSETERKQWLTKKIIEKGFQLEDYSIVKNEDDLPEIYLQYHASSDQILKEYGNEFLLKIIPFRLPYLEDPKKRKLPLQINYPVYMTDSIVYEIPKGQKLTNLPQKISLQSEYGEYEADFGVEGTKVKVIKHLKIKAACYPLSDYQKFYEFAESIRDAESSSNIVLIKE